jgi:thiol-disulfide isomerase/thioredoxin
MICNKDRKQRQALGIMLLVATLGIPLSTIAAPAGTVAVNPLVLGRTALTQKNYSKAVQIFQSAAKSDQYKNSAECRLGLGKSLYNLGSGQQGARQTETYKQAVKELRRALRLGKGSTNSVEANAIMLSLPKNITAPKLGADTPMIAMANGIRGMERGGEGPKPKVLEFYASWCEPCQKLKPIIDKAKLDYKDKVDFVAYDIDKPQSEKIVEDYEVSPIPTLIFLDSSNQVITYSIGYSGENGLKLGMKKILPPA